METSRRVFLLGIALLFLRGGEAIGAAHLTLNEVVQTVVLTNPEVLVKWHAFKSAGGDVDVGRAGFLPRVDYSFGRGKETLKQPGLTDRDYMRDGYTLTLSQMLYDGFGTANDVKRLDKARLTRYFELLDTAESAALEGSRAYFDVIRYRQLMLLAENNYIEHRSSYELLLRRAQAGAGRRVDVEHAASRLALAELNLNTEAANLHDVTARFLRLVGHPPPPVMFGPPRLNRDYPASQPEALKMAFRQSPTLRAAVENLESTQHDLEMRRSAFHPKLDLRLRNESTGNYQGVIGTRQNNVAEVLLSYNLFNGGADVARQKVYAERKNMAMDLRDKACVDVRQTVSIAYNDVMRLKAQQSNIDLQVSSIEKTRDAYKAQFNIGQRSLLDLLDTENELLNARRTAINAEIDLALAYLRTQAGIGRLLQFLGLKRIDEQEKAPDPAELAKIVETDICPPETPGTYLVDLDTLTARALATLDAANLPAPPGPSQPSGPVVSPPATAPLSYPPPMPAPRAPGTAAGAAATLALPAAPVAAKATAAADDQSLRIAAVQGPSAKVDKAGTALPAASVQQQENILAGRVKAWAAAWSAKAYAAYADFYAPSFRPADGSSRESWAKQRERRLATAERIQVEVRNFKLKKLSEDAFLAEFEQDYSSEKFSDTTLKVLKWARVGGQWLIERETARLASVGGPAGRKEAP